MLSLISTQIVKEFGKDRLSALYDISASLNVKPFTVVIETTPRFFIFKGNKQYKSQELQVSFRYLNHCDSVYCIIKN